MMFAEIRRHTFMNFAENIIFIIYNDKVLGHIKAYISWLFNARSLEPWLLVWNGFKKKL